MGSYFGCDREEKKMALQFKRILPLGFIGLPIFIDTMKAKLKRQYLCILMMRHTFRAYKLAVVRRRRT